MTSELKQPATGFSLATFFPGYFALVMATGILSIACHFLELHHVANVLLYLNIFFYVVLWIITILRLFRYRAEFIRDLTHHARGIAFLTMVAGTNVLGSQISILTPWIDIAKILWILGCALWVVLIYTFFTAVTVREPKPALENGINGAWLLITVSTESICVLGTNVARTFQLSELVFFVCLCCYLIGAMFYIVFISLIVYRWSFFNLPADMLTPPYWINMGALAITTLAGSRLLLNAGEWNLLVELSPFLKGFTLFFWATGSWWIPQLVIVGFWRHVLQKVPLKYDPQYWSLVFPLGMYAASTFLFAKAMELPFLEPISHLFLYVALIAWTITFCGMLVRIFRR
jgi:tellurite resistance protein TehA-like permease